MLLPRLRLLVHYWVIHLSRFLFETTKVTYFFMFLYVKQVIERIHQNFFAHKALDGVDVRNILASEQRKILAGCCIVFSRIFPVEEANPHLTQIWQTAQQFGAVCSNQIDEQVTHVVAIDLGTDKVTFFYCKTNA